MPQVVAGPAPHAGTVYRVQVARWEGGVRVSELTLTVDARTAEGALSEGAARVLGDDVGDAVAWAERATWTSARTVWVALAAERWDAQGQCGAESVGLWQVDADEVRPWQVGSAAHAAVRRAVQRALVDWSDAMHGRA